MTNKAPDSPNKLKILSTERRKELYLLTNKMRELEETPDMDSAGRTYSMSS